MTQTVMVALPDGGIYSDVSFTFYATQRPEILTGRVLVRPGEMVLEVDPTPVSDAYLVRGELSEGHFSGWNELGSDPVGVEAAWAGIGQRFVGLWIEEGVEYLFTFTLPEKPRHSSPKMKGNGPSKELHDLMKRMKKLDAKIAHKKKVQPRGTPSNGVQVPANTSRLTVGQRLLLRLKEKEKGNKRKRVVVVYRP
jgi:hypothetical protein